MIKKILVLLVPILFLACSSNTTPPPADNNDIPPQEPDSKTVLDLANVEEVEIQTLESYPLQYNTIARGNFRNGCEQIDEITKEYQSDSKTYKISIFTKMEGEICTQALVPFEEVISIETDGLEEGEITVDVNGVTETFNYEG